MDKHIFLKNEVGCDEDVINRQVNINRNQRIFTEKYLLILQVEHYNRTFVLAPAYTPGKHWVAVADIPRGQRTPAPSGDNKPLR